MYQLQAPKEKNVRLEPPKEQGQKPSPKEVPLYIRLILSSALLILGFFVSGNSFFKENPFLEKPLLAETLIAILMAVLGFYVLPRAFSGIKHWLHKIILQSVSDIVSNFWEQQSERMREARKEREIKKVEDNDNKRKERLENQLLLDTSVLIDGRILDIAKTGFLLRDVVIPEFVIKELHQLADSKDPMKRKKGRRGIDIVRQLKKDVTVYLESNGLSQELVSQGVDGALVEYAKMYKMILVSLDFTLNKVASFKDLKVININDLANALRINLLPGEELNLKIATKGQGKNQGVGYLDDGTMVVVAEGESQIGNVVLVKIKKSLQGSSGKMFFGEIVKNDESLNESQSASE